MRGPVTAVIRGPGRAARSGAPGCPQGHRVSSPIMPGKLAAGRAPARLPVPAASPAAVPVPKQLWTVDAALTPGSPVTEIAELTAAAGAAVRAGGGTVLETSHVVFPNGAVTLVLILAESHLA